jgi:hypothetical protein
MLIDTDLEFSTNYSLIDIAKDRSCFGRR